jgi:ubiquinone/menaquinone biosynthesis C-methylase UbiE
MVACDPHRFINELDEAIIERLISRLESRAQDKVFTRLLDNYIARLTLPAAARILEIGCGTGAVLRHIVRREEFTGKAVGVDQSLSFITTAQRFTRDEHLSEALEFHVGDAHNLEFPAACFDAVIAHTVISHVTDPQAVLQEMARVVRPGGSVVIFDGDYASLTYAYPDYKFGREMDQALVNATFNNPQIMRALPGLLAPLGLTLTAAWGDAVAEIGHASYFKSFAETYTPFVIKAGLLPVAAVETWLTAQHAAMEQGTFFAACNYYTYLATRVEESIDANPV